MFVQFKLVKAAAYASGSWALDVNKGREHMQTGIATAYVHKCESCRLSVSAPPSLQGGETWCMPATGGQTAFTHLMQV